MVQRNVALRVRVGAHTMAVPHPERVLFPSGFTSEDAVDYYRAVAPILLPHLAGRVVGGDAGAEAIATHLGEEYFGQKCEDHAFSEGSRLTVFPPRPSPADGTALAVSVATSALEIRVSPWMQAGQENDSLTEAGSADRPSAPGDGHRVVDRLIFAVMSEPWAGLLDCREAALSLRERLQADGHQPVVKTSGTTALHVWVAITPTDAASIGSYAAAVATSVVARYPGRIMPMPGPFTLSGESPRAGPGFEQLGGPVGGEGLYAGIDVDLGGLAVSTIAPYSLRRWEVVHRTGRAGPAVSAPITWHELERAQSAAELSFEPWEVVARLQRDGDLFAALLRSVQAA